MRATLTALANGWLDPESAPHQQLVRHRFLVAAAGLMCALLGLRSIEDFLSGSWANALAVLGASMVYPILLLILKRTGRPGPAANGMMLAGVALVVALIAHGSHLFATTPLYLGLLPLVATLTLGRRAGLLWCAISLTVLGALLVMHAWGLRGADHEWVPTVIRAVDIGIIVLMTTGLALTFDVAQQAALRQQEEHAVALVIENQVRRAAEHSAREAEAAARVAMDARTRFLASMSHELRTPLHGVIGATHLIDGDALPDDQRQMLHTAQNSADLLLSLIDDVLDYARLDAAAVRLEQVPFDLHATLTEVASPLGLQVQNKPVTVRVEVEAGLHVWRSGDPTRLRQILLNLAGNAIKFTNKGSVTLRAKSSPGGVRLEVCDTGIGMDKESLERVFQPFVQAEGSTTRRFGGTGLGLAIVRRLVDVHRGTLDVTSEVGKGTTFSITLPLPRATPVAPDSMNVTPSERLRVLVVDDSAVNRTLAMHMLKRAGHDPVEVSGGLSALAITEAQSFDAVLMDCQMPELDGLQTTLRMRARGDTRAIIGLSASAQPEDRSRALESGMNAYLTKPITPKALALAISVEASKAAKAA